MSPATKMLGCVGCGKPQEVAPGVERVWCPDCWRSDRCDGDAVTCSRPPAYIIGSIKACREHVIDVLDCYLLDPPGGFERFDSLTVSAVPTP